MYCRFAKGKAKWQTHLPKAIASPLKELLTQVKVTAHSKHPHMREGILSEGNANMTRSAQSIGTHKRLMWV